MTFKPFVTLFSFFTMVVATAVVFLLSGIPASAEDAPRDTGIPIPAAEFLRERGSLPFRDAVERYYGLERTGYIGKIIGGKPADWKNHKWQAALLFSDNPVSEQAMFCGGSLVRNNWVVTAAHCVYNEKFGVHKPEWQDVLTGTEDLSSSRGKRLGVEAIYVHEKFRHKIYYNRGIPVNDIALLKLNGDGKGEPIKPLTEKEELRIVVSKQTAIIAGWGITESGSPSPLLKWAEVLLVDRRKCNGPAAYEGAIEDNMLCAGTDTGSQDACKGDSGGPITKGGFLIGIVSWASDDCGKPFQYGVYTRVSQFTDWIEACINDPGSCKSK